MKSLIENTRQLGRELSAEKGPFSLFALLLREDAPGKWDLVVSAPWVGADRGTALRLVSAKVKQDLAPAELLAISRIVIVEPDSPEVQAINRSYPVEGSTVEVARRHFFRTRDKARAHFRVLGGGYRASRSAGIERRVAAATPEGGTQLRADLSRSFACACPSRS